MNNTSSQDEFAKWAKLRRKHDKIMEDYEAISMHAFPPYTGGLDGANTIALPDKSLSDQKSSFDWTVKIARWLSTNGLKVFLQFYYTKTPIFALPAGWLPYYVQWVLSFPRAPLGSVSIQVWSNVCATAIAAMADFVTSVLLESRIAQKQAVPAGAGNGKKS